jgi:polysaccharide biosynthesis protein PslG
MRGVAVFLIAVAVALGGSVHDGLLGASAKAAKRPLAEKPLTIEGPLEPPRPLIKLSRRPHRLLGGLNDDWHVNVPDLRYASDLGARLIRFPASWQDVQPAGPGQWDWLRLDQVMGEAAARGLGVVLALTGAPAWTHAGPSPGLRPETPVPPNVAYLPHWEEFVRQVAVRYPALTAVEIWNEQNISPFWGGLPDPAHYALLLDSAYRAVKSVRPDLPVLYGGLCPIVDGSGAPPGEMGMGAYLKRSYAAGAKGRFDALSVHPYPLPMWRGDYLREIRLQLGDARQVMARQGEPLKPIWVTEAGFTTYSGPDRVTEAQQAKRLSAAYRMFARVRRLPVVIVHRLRDISNPLVTDGGWGLLRHDYSPKPAYSRAAGLFRVP